jgi:hypothetical protein
MTHARPTWAASRALRAVSKRPASIWQIRQEWLNGNVAELAGKPDGNDADSAGMAHKVGIGARGRHVLQLNMNGTSR